LIRTSSGGQLKKDILFALLFMEFSDFLIKKVMGR